MSLTLPVYSLGAEELIELGKPRRAKPFLSARKPYFKRDGERPFIGNPAPPMGASSVLAKAGSYLTDFLSKAFSVLARIVDVPVDNLASGTDLLASSVSSLIVEVPALGILASQILLISKSIIRFGLQVPGEFLGGISNVIAGIGKALETLPLSRRADASASAMKKIVDRAPEPLKDAVSAMLSGTRPLSMGDAGNSGGQPGATTPTATGASSGADGAGSGLEKVLVVGAVVAAVGALWLLVT